MDKQGKLSRTDCRLLRPYLAHHKARGKDVETEQDVLDELEWLEENGLVKEVKKGVYDKTKKGHRLNNLLNSIEKEAKKKWMMKNCYQKKI